MGSLYSKFNNTLSTRTGSVTEIITGKKRKRGDDDDDSNDELSKNALEKTLNTPKRKKLQTTTQYIYEKLFKDGKDSDISVMVLNKIWHLHKIYLCQSPYFASMFNGSWKETKQHFIRIEIEDPNINIEAIETVFGSLYLDEITLVPTNITSVLATATIFQLETLIDKCIEIMIETINIETVVNYYETSCEYGVKNLIKPTFNWLLVNLLCLFSRNYEKLRPISIDLMEKLTESSNLFVMQTEFSLYTLLRFWLFLKLHPDYVLDQKKSDSKSEHYHYFEKLNKKTPFLLTANGKPYKKVFKKLRIQHLVTHPTDLRILMEDNVIPLYWLNDPIMQHWDSVLKFDQCYDNGPKECDKELFHENCIRWGRILNLCDIQKWRWTGFNFGLDLILITDTKILSIKRHHRAEQERLLSFQMKRQFLIRVRIASLNEQRQIKHSQETDITLITLGKNEEISLLTMDNELEYPVYISVNLLVVTPKLNLNKDSAEISNIGSDTVITKANNNNNNGSTNDNNYYNAIENNNN